MKLTASAPFQIVNGYNFAFCADRALLPPLPNNYQSLMQLFEVIFTVYMF